jgi:hypothetical protein
MNVTGISEEDWNAVAAERDAPPQDPAPATPPPPPVEEEVVEPAEQTPPQESQESPKPTIDPEIQAKLKRLDELAAVMPQLVNELREAKGRIGALQSRLDKAQVEQPTKKEVAAAAKDPDKWEALKKDFPEWGEAIAEFVEAKLGGVAAGPTGPSPEEIEQLVAERAAATTEQAVRELNEKLVSLKYPKWKDTVKTDAFLDWFSKQPADLQALAGSKDGLDAISVLDKFAEASKPPEVDDRKQRLAAAASAPRQPSAGVVSKKFEDMTPQEQWNYVAQQREKQGR